MRAIKLHLLLVVVSLILNGCSSFMMSNKKLVENNTFFSTSLPKVKIAVDSEYKYLGKYKQNRTLGEHGSSVVNDTYIFSKYDENRRIQSGVEIRVNRINKGSAYWISDIFGHYKEKILNNVIDVSGKKYQQVILINSPVNVSFYTEKGFICPYKRLARGIAKNVDSNNQIQIQIYYWEDMELFNEKIYGNTNYQYSGWLVPSSYDVTKQKAINEFMQRAEDSFVISDISSEELERIKNGINSIISDTDVEDKLIKIKELYDRDLITEQEYNNKRKEIIDKL